QFADGTTWTQEEIHNKGLVVRGTEGDDHLQGLHGEADVLYGEGGADSIYGASGNDTLYGGIGNDSLYGEAGDDQLDGGDGDDILMGGDGADTLAGGRGNDILQGGNGSNTFVYNVGDGADRIIIEKDSNTISFNWNWRASHDWNGVNWIDGGSDAFDWFGETSITINGETESSIQLGAADGSIHTHRIGGVSFTSRVQYLSDNILEIYLEAEEGFEGNEVSIRTGGNLGSDGSEEYTEGTLMLNGKEVSYVHSRNVGGNDPNIFFVMIPEGEGAPATYEKLGDDLYGNLENVKFPVRILIIPSRHEPQEIASLLENHLYTATDVLQLGEGITPEGVEITRNGNDLIIHTGNEGDTITVEGWYAGNKLESIRFADGTTWTQEEIHNKGLVVRGTEGDDHLQGLHGEADVLYGEDGADSIYGATGNDTLYGGTGNDSLYGEAGDDQLYGGDGDDILIGGVGNDRLQGSYGNDTYVFGRGDGQDVIYDYDYDLNNQDIVNINDDILNIIIYNSGNDLVLSLNGSTDSLIIEDWGYGTAYQVDVFKSSDGSQLLNTQVNQLIQAMASYTQDNGITWSQAIEERPDEVTTILAQYWTKPQF
ncbi:calcium-binding protein, partial [Thermolongibacillus altinsuensis]